MLKNAANTHRKNTKSFRNTPQTAPNEKVGVHEKVEFACEKPSQITIFMKNSQREDHCTVIFHISVWPEVTCEIDFCEKTDVPSTTKNIDIKKTRFWS